MRGLSYTKQMVLAWMAGDKDLTRRLINPQPPSPLYHLSRQSDSSASQGRRKNGHYCWMLCDGAEILDRHWIRQSYTEGETVYIKETWAESKNVEPYPPSVLLPSIIYKADPRWHSFLLVKWKSPRFMPEWAARSRALVLSVRPEQIQSITYEEAVREGMPHHYNTPENGCQALQEFQKLWEIIHPGSWERNDWVWRIHLDRILYGGNEKNLEKML